MRTFVSSLLLPRPVQKVPVGSSFCADAHAVRDSRASCSSAR